MADVEIRFLGDTDEAEHSVNDLKRALELLSGIIESVSKALGDIKISPGAVASVVSGANAMKSSLRDLEDQANDTRRALSMQELAAVGGPAATMIGAFARNIPFYGNTATRSTVQPIGVASNDPSAAGLAQQWMSVQRAGVRDRQIAAWLAVQQAARGGGGGGFVPLPVPGGDGGGGGGAGMGLLAALGWGHQLRVPGFGRWGGFGLPFAGLGTPLGLAGFGAERLLGTTLGIGGSMLGAVAGGALYGLGLGGLAAVGMGTDMAGVGQAAGDIRTVAKDYNALNTAIAEYGKNSLQAAQAQSKLNQDLNSFAAVARPAVEQAAKAANNFHQLFDYFTGPAEKTGAQIIGQGINVGTRFLPVFGRYAAQNTRIIQSGLQPLFAWMQNPSQQGTMGGLGIFSQLEQLFQQRLPQAVHAGTQAFEIFAHVVLDAAKQTGGFLPKLDEFLTKMNTKSGLAEINRGVVALMGLFHAWLDLILAVGRTLYELFRPAVGLGKDFAQQLTSIIDLFNKWLQMTSTQTALHNIFSAHKAQLDAVFAVLRALLPILEATITSFLKIETVIVRLTVGPLKALADLINLLNKIPFFTTVMGWVGALALVYKGMKMILELKMLSNLTGLTTVVSNLAAAETTAGLAASGMATRLAAMAGPIGVAALAVLGLDKAIAKLTGFDAIRKAWGSAGWGADNAGGPDASGINHNPFPVGTSNWFEFEAGRKHMHAGNATIGGSSGNVDPHSPAYKSGLKASQHPGSWSKPKKNKTAPDGANIDWHSFVGYHRGEDCSLFTQRVYQELWHISIPRTSEEQFSGGYPAAGTEVGDLLFYNGHNIYKPPGHVAMCIGNGQLIQDNGSGTVQIMDVGALDSLGYMGARTYLPKNAISTQAGTGASNTFNPTLNTRVPSSLTNPTGTNRAGSRLSTLAQGQTTLGNINALFGDLGTLPTGWRDRFLPALRHDKAEIERLDEELKNKSLSQKTIDTIRGRIDLISAAVDNLTKKIHTAVQAFTELTTGRSLIHQAKIAGTGTLAQLGLNLGPLNPFDVHTLDSARSKFDPKLREWEKQLQEMDKTLREKTVSEATVNTIKLRMTRIQNDIQNALQKIKDAAATQLQAAQNAWSTFISSFDSTFSAGQQSNQNSSQISAMQQVIGQGQLAINLDQAQSAILGGKPGNDQLAQQIINNMTAALGVQTTGTGIPYTQQQLDNWLTLWGNYYASLGYTPQQMFDAFNKLLASVGLPPIDNPFSTGDLPLPPGAGPSTSTTTSSGTTGGGGGPRPIRGPHGFEGSAARAGNLARQHSSSRGGHHAAQAPRAHHRIHIQHHGVAAGGAHDAAAAVHVETHPHIEIKFEKGLEWLDKHVQVIVDGEIAAAGRAANHRARSGRH